MIIFINAFLFGSNCRAVDIFLVNFLVLIGLLRFAEYPWAFKPGDESETDKREEGKK